MQWAPVKETLSQGLKRLKAQARGEMSKGTGKGKFDVVTGHIGRKVQRDDNNDWAIDKGGDVLPESSERKEGLANRDHDDGGYHFADSHQANNDHLPIENNGRLGIYLTG